MRDQFTLPIFETINGSTYELTAERECAVELEPDEGTCLASWYIARVYVEVRAKGKPVWIQVKDTDPLFETIKAWALQERDVVLAELWNDYLDDVPASKRPPYDDNAEHRTY